MKLLILFLMLICAGCHFAKTRTTDLKTLELEKQAYLNCFATYHDSISKLAIYKEVKQKFTDSLNSWIALSLAPKGNFEGDIWKVEDAIFFNGDKTKCILLISVLAIDSVKKYDMVKINVGEIINGNWHFYYKSYPAEYYFRDNNYNKPYTAQQIINNSIYNICSDGFIILESCKVNGKYVESEIWFMDWMREQHKVFLHH